MRSLYSDAQLELPLNSLRIKVLSMRLSESEMLSVITASKRDGKSQANWLRETILQRSQPPVDAPCSPSSLILLEEILKLRTILINLFRSAVPSYQTETIRATMAYADEMKRELAAEIMRDASTSD